MALVLESQAVEANSLAAIETEKLELLSVQAAEDWDGW